MEDQSTNPELVEPKRRPGRPKKSATDLIPPRPSDYDGGDKHPYIVEWYRKNNHDEFMVRYGVLEDLGEKGIVSKRKTHLTARVVKE